MPATQILALDIATKTGWALGAPGTMPKVDVERFKRTSEDTWFVADGAAKFIRDVCFIESTRPDLIVFEASLPNFESKDEREGEREIVRSAASMLTPPLIIGAVRGIAACYGIQCEMVYPSTWRKHFLGRANFGNREATKWQTLKRCYDLKYLPITCKDDNQADACGIFDYASSVYGRAAPAFSLTNTPERLQR